VSDFNEVQHIQHTIVQFINVNHHWMQDVGYIFESGHSLPYCLI